MTLSFFSILKRTTIAFLALIVIGTPAKATYNYYYHHGGNYGNGYYDAGYFDVVADAGTYSPVALGESVTLDACGSLVRAADGGDPVYNLCTEIPDYSIFGITWTITYDDITETIASFSGSNIVSGLQYTLATGAGSLITQAGSYIIGLWLDFDSDSSFWIELPTYCQYGTVGFTGGDSGYIASESGYRNTDYSQTALTISGGAQGNSNNGGGSSSVPEPSAALLLIPGLALLLQRERRRRRKARA